MCTETALGDKRTFGVLASLAVLCNDCNYSREKLTSHKVQFLSVGFKILWI